MNRTLFLFLLYLSNLSAESTEENDESFNCVESLSAAQFLAGFGVGALTFVGGMMAGGSIANEYFPENFDALILMTGLTGSIGGGIGIFGTWKLFCDGNKKNYVTFKVSHDALASQWVFNF